MHPSVRLSPWQHQAVIDPLVLFSLWALSRVIRLGFWWTPKALILLLVRLWPPSCLGTGVSTFSLALQVTVADESQVTCCSQIAQLSWSI